MCQFWHILLFFQLLSKVHVTISIGLRIYVRGEMHINEYALGKSYGVTIVTGGHLFLMAHTCTEKSVAFLIFLNACSIRLFSFFIN